MTDFKQDFSIPTAQQLESLTLSISEPLMGEYWRQEVFNDTETRQAFEARIVELAKGNPATFKAEYLRGLAWLCFKHAGLLNTEMIAKLELIPLFKKYSTEFDMELNFEAAAKIGYRYLACDQFEMIGGDY